MKKKKEEETEGKRQERKKNKKKWKKISELRQNNSHAEEHLVFYFATMWVRASDANSVFCMGLFFYSLAGFSTVWP